MEFLICIRSRPDGGYTNGKAEATPARPMASPPPTMALKRCGPGGAAMGIFEPQSCALSWRVATFLEFAVVRTGSHWSVLTNDGQRGAFDYRIDAEEAALRLAARAEARGFQTKVLVQAANGELRPIAT